MTTDTTQSTTQPANPAQALGLGVNFGQLGVLQQLLSQIFMYMMSFIDADSPTMGPLNNLFSSIMGMNGEQYTNWRNDISAHDGEWKSRTDFSNTNFGGMRDTVMNPPQNLLDLISMGEHSTANTRSGQDYNTAYGNRHVNFTDMTVDQVIAWQRNDPGNSAAGRYQIIGTTLRGLKSEMGLNGNEKFDESMQDRMAGVLMERRGLSDFLNGDMSESQFMRNMSKEWASLPKDMNGASYYAGDGLNHARVAPEAVIAVFRAEREQAAAPQLARETGSAASRYAPEGNLQVAAGPVREAFSGPAAGVPSTSIEQQRQPTPTMVPAAAPSATL